MVSEEKMFEIVDGRRKTDAGVTGKLIAHPWAFGSGTLKRRTIYAYPLFGLPSNRFTHFYKHNILGDYGSYVSELVKDIQNVWLCAADRY